MSEENFEKELEKAKAFSLQTALDDEIRRQKNVLSAIQNRASPTLSCSAPSVTHRSLTPTPGSVSSASLALPSGLDRTSRSTGNSRGDLSSTALSNDAGVNSNVTSVARSRPRPNRASQRGSEMRKAAIFDNVVPSGNGFVVVPPSGSAVEDLLGLGEASLGSINSVGFDSHTPTVNALTLANDDKTNPVNSNKEAAYSPRQEPDAVEKDDKPLIDFGPAVTKNGGNLESLMRGYRGPSSGPFGAQVVSNSYNHSFGMPFGCPNPGQPPKPIAQYAQNDPFSVPMDPVAAHVNSTRTFQCSLDPLVVPTRGNQSGSGVRVEQSNTGAISISMNISLLSSSQSFGGADGTKPVIGPKVGSRRSTPFPIGSSLSFDSSGADNRGQQYPAGLSAAPAPVPRPGPRPGQARPTLKIVPEPRKPVAAPRTGGEQNSPDLMMKGVNLSDWSDVGVEAFDPLYSPDCERKKTELQSRWSELNAEVEALVPRFKLSETAGMAHDESSTVVRTGELQDPFSYEELSLSVITNAFQSTESLENASADPGGSSSMDIMAAPMAGEDRKSYGGDHPDDSDSVPSDVCSTTSGSVGPTEESPRPRSIKKNLPVDKRTCDEFTAFAHMIKTLKKRFESRNVYTNRGVIISPMSDLPLPDDNLTVPVKVYLGYDQNEQPISFNCDVNASVELVLGNVLASSADTSLASQTNLDDFSLQVFGYSEYLLNDSQLSDYSYVHQCLKTEEPIRFLLRNNDTLTKPFLRNEEDDEEEVYVIKDELHGDKSFKLSATKFQVLMDVYSSNLSKVRSQLFKTSVMSTEIQGLFQAVKGVTSLLGGLETCDIKRAKSVLSAVVQDVQMLATPGNDHTNRISMVDMGIRFEAALEGLSKAVDSLVSMYCQTFHVSFQSGLTRTPQYKETRLVSEMGECLKIHVATIHLPSSERQGGISSYRVQCGVFYGSEMLTEDVSSEPVARNAMDTTIYIDEWLEFRDLALCRIPREARLILTIMGRQPASEEWKCLGWVATSVFDFRKVLMHGQHLFSCWNGSPHPIDVTGSNIFHAQTYILQINMSHFDEEIVFPPSHEVMAYSLTTEVSDLSEEDRKELDAILAKGYIESLDSDDKDFLWVQRRHLCARPEALPLVLQSVHAWDYAGTHSVSLVLELWDKSLRRAPLTALELLLPRYRSELVRQAAVGWLRLIGDDELCDYLPQLVQALKFENYHDSALARFLLERSLQSILVAHRLYWMLKDAACVSHHRDRYKLMFGGVASVMGAALRKELDHEEALMKHIDAIATRVKDARDKERVMRSEIGELQARLQQRTSQVLPLNPSVEASSLDDKLCTYFNSFTVPLKLVFKNSDSRAASHYIMYKSGDDLRQDMLVMQLIGLMDKLWQKHGLDLKIVTFSCLPTGINRGLVELVTECETLRKIHTARGGVTGSFKDDILLEWLHRHNPREKDFDRAIENFTVSCAGYCVATYILGIGDRHNDNIMIKKSGHLFHIDFGKFLGEVQKAGNFSRDRVPFVLTPDMAHVINRGDKPTEKFQQFVDLCCESFNVLRRNSLHLLTALNLMTRSGIQRVDERALAFIHATLLPGKTDSEATTMFTQMIHNSVKALFPQINFFIHNLAQKKFSSHSDGELLSFIPQTYSIGTDGKIVNAEIFGYQKRKTPEKYYIYIIKVSREREKDPSFVFRRYSEFLEFHAKLKELFPRAQLPTLPGSIMLGRTHIKKVTEKRKAELDIFLKELLNHSKEISEHDLIYTFFHPMIRDQQESTNDQGATVTSSNGQTGGTKPATGGKEVTGHVKLSVSYVGDSLCIMVMHAKELLGEMGDAPDPYVKTYLLPDPVKVTKRKTKVVKDTFHPTYNEMIRYKLDQQEARYLTLQVTLWSSDRVTVNQFLGAARIPLGHQNAMDGQARWYRLGNMNKVN